MRAFARIVVLAFALPAAAAAPAPEPLTGTYAFVGKTLVDPPPNEPRDSHLLLVLDGAAARDLYRKMKGKPQRDACLDDGSLSKTAGNIRCTEAMKPKGYACSFAIDLAAQRIVQGAVC